jgi:hypothetical protein
VPAHPLSLPSSVRQPLSHHISSPLFLRFVSEEKSILCLILYVLRPCKLIRVKEENERDWSRVPSLIDLLLPPARPSVRPFSFCLFGRVSEVDFIWRSMHAWMARTTSSHRRRPTPTCSPSTASSSNILHNIAHRRPTSPACSSTWTRRRRRCCTTPTATWARPPPAFQARRQQSSEREGGRASTARTVP